MKKTGVLVGLLSILLPSIHAQTARRAPAAAEQRSFSSEGILKRPVAIPQTLMALLAEDPAVKDALEDQNLPSSKLPKSWFAAAEIHLNGPQEQDIIVLGDGPLRGAHVITFWVFRPKQVGFDLLLRAVADTVVIKRAASKGYNDIEALSVVADRVATALFRFDGVRYRVVERGSTKIQE